ncbi:expressed unknown protein [Seminavis robusta]|uniref:Uncharacterized protein n=1 Tax=Seminavis robusta TaxID=568900 RepID=A0A9N8DQ29_9STRA|nr:expressed unknown protein [Seminavis robusta]|eukprot:Sro274_g105350.1 n/a (230) ;mRNA; r:23515-24341
MRLSLAISTGIATLLCTHVITAFAPQLTTGTNTRASSASKMSAQSEQCTRRQSLEQAGLIAVGSFFANASPAAAKQSSQEAALEVDKQKLVAGYNRLNYLLDNWEKETTNCKTKTQYSSASNPCERTPLRVQIYLGYTSTEDPLFRADKTMRRLEVLVPAGSEVEYLDAMEKYNEKAEEGSGNAYTSSWGEANPGGGKDRIEYFVERAKSNVVDARDALGVVVKILGLV